MAQGRLRRLVTRGRAKWVGLVVALVIAIVYLMSVWWSVHVGRVGESGYYGVWVDDGSFGVMRLRGKPKASGSVGVEFGAAEGASVQPWFNWRGFGAIVPVEVPLWFPLLLIAAPTAYLWHTDRRAKVCVKDQLAQGDVAEHDTLLLAYLGGHDEPCPMCEYNLRGLTGTVCPECGEALWLSVSLREPKMAAYLCGLIGLSVGVGISGIFLVLGVINFLLYGSVAVPPYWVLVPWGFQFVIEGLAMWWWLARRTWIRRRSRGQRWMLAAAAWGCTIGFVVLIFTMAFY